MPERSCIYIPSTEVVRLLEFATIEELVKVVVNKAYDQNMIIGGMFVTRFVFFTVDGKVADGDGLLKGLKHHPNTVRQILPIVCLTEKNGEDVAYIILQSEIKNYPELYEGMKEFLNQPPNISVEQLIKDVNE